MLAVPVVAGMMLGMTFGLGPIASVSAIAALLLAVLAPYAGLAVLAFMAPLVPPAIVPSPGFDTVLVGAILVGCIYRLPLDRPQIRISAPFVLVLAFLGFVTVQQLPELAAGYTSAADHDVGFLYLQLVSAVGTILVAGHLLRDRSPYPIIAMAMASAGLVACIAVASNGQSVIAPPLSNLVAPSSDLGRATGSFSNPNYLGAYAAVMLVAGAGLFMAMPGRLARAALGVDIILLSAALAVSLSRGGFLAAVAGVALLLVARGRALALTILVTGAIGAAFIYPIFVQWRLETLVGSASPQAFLIMEQSDGGRLTGLAVAPALFLSSPITGIGFGHFVPVSVTVSGSSTPINAHNWYLTVLAEQGIVGAILVALAAIAVVIRVWSLPAARRALAYGILGALAMSSLFLEPPTSFQMLATPLIILVAAITATWRIAPPGSAGR